MTSGAILSRTTSLGLARLRFNFPNWGDEYNRNMEIVDAAMQTVGVAFDGVWENNTSFPVGSKIIDPIDVSFWRALVAHTSPATGTFAEARAAEPSHWEEIANVINFRGEWADATAYQLNDIVFSGYKWAIVVETHTSTTSFDTGVSAGNLEIFFDATAVVNETESHKTAAETAATNAATSETNAGNSAAAAAISATNAGNSETAAGTSETNAANSADAAATSETNAGNSATAAATSETNAATSETNAASSATAAAASEDAAADSAAAALVSENNAAATLAGALQRSGGTMNGPLSTPSFGGIPSTTSNPSSGTGAQLMVGNGAMDAGFLLFRKTSYAAAIGVDTDNKLKYGGGSLGANAYEVWHDGNKAFGTGAGNVAEGNDSRIVAANTAINSRLGASGQSITDWNNAVSNGWYRALNGDNAPEATGWFLGYVEVHDSNWITQTVHGFTNDSPSDTKTWRRDQNNGTWGSWYRLRISQQEQTALYVLNSLLTTRGDIPYRGASAWQRLAKGTEGQVLTMGANDPFWGAAPLTDVGAAIAALSFGAVGTYVLGHIVNTSVTEGSTYAGSSINPAGHRADGASYGSADDFAQGGGTRGSATLSGTWRAMGRSNNVSGTSIGRMTLFMRIS